MSKRTPNQQGQQGNAEGEHGGQTHRRHIEQLESRPAESSREERLEAEHRRTTAAGGKRRLVEDRQQHDEAERNSERGERASDAE